MSLFGWKSRLGRWFGGSSQSRPRKSNRASKRRTPEFAWVSETLEKRMLLSADSIGALVSGSPATEIAVTGGDPFSFDVQYDSTGVANTTGGEDNVTVRVHFDSNAITFDSLTDGLTGADISNDPDLAAVTVEDDTADLDGDPNTDSFVTVTFTSQSELPAPATLFTANFTAAVSQTDVTNVNFTGEVDAGDTLTTTSLAVDAVGPQPVLTGPSEPVGLGPFVVMIEFGEDVTGIAPSDLVLGNATLLDFRGNGGSFEATIRAQVGGDVTVDIPAGAVQDADGNDSLAATQLVVVAQEQDFGDAPDTYNTTLLGGPRHFDAGPTLGELRDVESDAESPLDGSGDDVNGVTQSSVTETIVDAAIVTLQTNFGPLSIQLDPDAAPLTVENFLQYVTDGDYNNVIFHRLASGFVLQGGGFSTTSEIFTSTAQFTDIPSDPPVQNEFNRSNLRGTIAMAKVGGNPNSATNEFFFNLGDNSGNLDNQNGGFTVFGELLDLTLLDQLAQFNTQDSGGAFDELPLDADGRLIVIQFVGVGSASGVVFDDANGNGVQDGGELGTENVTIFADINNNGQLDDGDLSTVTDADGAYTIEGLPLGDVVIRQIQPVSTVQSRPLPGEGYTLTVNVGSVFEGVHFANIAAVDAAVFPPSGDEDGVRISDDFRLITGTSDEAVVTISNSAGDARLYAWIDFNGDGDFEDGGEQIADGTGSFADLADGEVVVPFNVPTDFTGTTFARFRISTAAGLGIGGEAVDGEVEDYALLVEDPDVTPPQPVITGPESPSTESTFEVTIDFGEAVAGFEASDIVVGNGTVTNISGGGGGGAFVVTIDATTDGEVTVDVPADAAADASGNSSLAAAQFAVFIDSTLPQPVLSGPDTTNQATFNITIDFGETVDGFEASDLSVNNGTINALTGGTNGLFTATITRNIDGVVTIQLGEGRATDEAGNPNRSADPLEVEVDTVRPTPTFSGNQNVGQRQFTVTVDFDEAVTGFDASDVNVNNGTVQSVSPLSDSTFLVTVNAVADGNVTLSIPDGAAEDNFGNLSLPSEPFTVSVDSSPAVTRLAVGAGPRTQPQVRVFDPASGDFLFSFLAYDAGFDGGVRVATGDVNGDGVEDIITAAGRGGGPHVKVFNGSNGEEIRSFMAYDSGFTGGVYVAAGDINNDGFADIITGAGEKGGPHVKVFSGQTGEVLQSFMAYNVGFNGGVRVAAADINRDGVDDVITGAGEGGGPHVKVFDGLSTEAIRSFMAYNSSPSGGVFVAAGDINGDGVPDIVTGAGEGGGSHVRAFDGTDSTVQRDFFAYGPGFTGGVRVTVAEVNDDDADDIITAAGEGGGPHLRAFDGLNLNPLRSEFPFDEAFTGGIFVG